MKSLQTILKQLYIPFTQIEGATVTHYKRAAQPPCLVWTEDGEDGSFHADNHKQNQKITGYLDYFTLTEFDPMADEIQSVLDAEGVGWYLDTVDYEDETNLIHYHWVWQVV